MNYFDFDPMTFHGCYSMQTKAKMGLNQLQSSSQEGNAKV
jgi:hypothetical protein